MGRAIVRNPKVFLMDEPLSNLDAKLRGQMRIEISKLHQRLGTTIIYVTHDQTEAMTLGTRIVVMNAGVVQQVDTPQVLIRYTMQPLRCRIHRFTTDELCRCSMSEVNGNKVALQAGPASIELTTGKSEKTY